jgi:DNA-binding transcriptional LysR family regulator
VPPLDLDIANVRAFAVTARELHFGRAAGKLSLSQQGLSKRIRRLESGLGVDLFVRTGGSVRLTDAGHRFLPHAEHLVETADTAVAASQPSSAGPLRVDVWGHVQWPLRLVRELVDRNEDIAVEVSMRRSTGAALDALLRGEIDAAFGNPDDPDASIPPEVAQRRVGEERMHVLAPADHPLAAAAEVIHTDLARYTMWWPKHDVAPEICRWASSFARQHGIALEIHGCNLGAEHLVQSVAGAGDRLSLYGAEWPIPPDSPVRLVPLVDPVLLYPWSLLWLPANTHPRLPDFLAELPPVKLPTTSGVWTGIVG